MRQKQGGTTYGAVVNQFEFGSAFTRNASVYSDTVAALSHAYSDSSLRIFPSTRSPMLGLQRRRPQVNLILRVWVITVLK